MYIEIGFFLAIIFFVICVGSLLFRKGRNFFQEKLFDDGLFDDLIQNIQNVDSDSDFFDILTGGLSFVFLLLVFFVLLIIMGILIIFTWPLVVLIFNFCNRIYFKIS